MPDQGDHRDQPRDLPRDLPRWAAPLMALVAAAVAFARLEPTTRSTIWAEDGRVFVMDALLGGPFDPVLTPYDGYLHLVPRVLAGLVVAVVPADLYAPALAAAACLVAGAVAGLVLVLSGSVTRRPGLRVALAALTVLVPALPLQVLGNLANVHWFGLWLLPWLLLARPRTRAGAWGLGVVTLVVALTEVQALYAVPLVLWRWRDRSGWPVRAGLLLGLAAQTVSVLLAERSAAVGALPDPRALVKGFVINAEMTLWVGSPVAISAVLLAVGGFVVLLLVLPNLAALVVVLRRASGPTANALRCAAVVLPAAALVVWTGALVVNRTPQLLVPTPEQPITLLRYAPVPSMFLAAALLLTWAVPLARPGRVLRVVGSAVLAVVVLTTFRPALTERSEGPVWSEEVETSGDVCEADPALEVQVLPVAPEGWAAQVPCDVLEESAG